MAWVRLAALLAFYQPLDHPSAANSLHIYIPLNFMDTVS